jgi:hypothetical protein
VSDDHSCSLSPFGVKLADETADCSVDDMSQLLIQTYLSELNRLKMTSGVVTEQVIRPAFRRLLDHWARAEDLVFIEELEYATPLQTKVYPDGTVLYTVLFRYYVASATSGFPE